MQQARNILRAFVIFVGAQKIRKKILTQCALRLITD